jgi:hypothetical protein
MFERRREEAKPNKSTALSRVLTNVAAPATPAAGLTNVYVDSTSKNLAVASHDTQPAVNQPGLRSK